MTDAEYAKIAGEYGVPFGEPPEPRTDYVYLPANLGECPSTELSSRLAYAGSLMAYLLGALSRVDMDLARVEGDLDSVRVAHPAMMDRRMTSRDREAIVRADPRFKPLVALERRIRDRHTFLHGQIEAFKIIHSTLSRELSRRDTESRTSK